MHLAKKKQLSILVSGIVVATGIFLMLNSVYFSQGLPYHIAKNGEVMGTGYSCGGSHIPISVVNAHGFVNVTRPYADKLSGFFEFVLKPNSVGDITMLYDFSQESSPTVNPLNPGKSTTQNILANSYHQSMAEYFGDIDISKVNDQTNKTDDDNNITYLSNRSIKGMSVYPSNISNVTDSVVKVTYTIKTDSEVEQGTYLLGLKICPGEMVTIGNEPTQMPLPWDNNEGWY